MKFSVYTVAIYFSFVVSLVQAQAFEQKAGYTHLSSSPEGQYITFCQNQGGFYMLNMADNKTSLIDDNKFSAYGASFANNNQYVAFKKFIELNGTRLQQPVLYTLQNGKIIELFEATRRCGTPSFSGDGKIVFTVGKILYILDQNHEIQKTIQLPAYSNLTPISPDGKSVIFNDKKDQLWKINLDSEVKTKLTDSAKGYFEPLWSPDSKKIAANTLNGDLVVFDVEKNSRIEIGKGTHPNWTNDSQFLIYSKSEILLNRKIENQDIFAYHIKTRTKSQLTNSDQFEDYPIVANNKLFYSISDSEQLFKANINLTKNELQLFNSTVLNFSLQSGTKKPEIPLYKKKELLNAVYFDIPYVNQRYDTPDWFNGNWACGATAAIQCIAFFGLVDQWPVWASTPYPHISDYGNYICEIYTYNGYTFNIGGRDPNGTIGYGGYGFIIQNNWANTKDYMRQYAQKHGLGSAVDWSPSRDELAIEITNEDPFVLLNSLTSAGHYISVIGYDDLDTTTVIVNDPYGDKNLGYANYHGRRAWYDWPGYNNGYENLNTVWCYIYFRGDPPADISVDYFTVNADTASVSQTLYVDASFTNIGRMPSIASNIEFFVSENGVHDENAYSLNIFPLPALNVGQSFSIQDSITLPDSLISDTYKLSVFADCDTLNPEMLKDNNVRSVDMVIYGYPRLYSILPVDGSVIYDYRPDIRVKYQDYITAIHADSVKLFLDAVDITDSCNVGLRRIDFTPGYDLDIGVHNLAVQVPNLYGITSVYNWSFDIQPMSGLTNNNLYNPNQYYLTQNYPNPFNPSTQIQFNLPRAGKISLSVYDLNGELIQHILEEQHLKKGLHQVHFRAGSLASGVYIYTLKVDNLVFSKKMLLIR